MERTTHKLHILAKGGLRQLVNIEVEEPSTAEDEPTYKVSLKLDEHRYVGISERGIFFALQQLRLKLESEEILIDCFGASVNVYPSPMMESMGPVAKAYRLEIGRQTVRTDIVDVFATDEAVVPATVHDQEAFHEKWCDHWRKSAAARE